MNHPEPNRILLLLRIWEQENNLTLSLEVDKIRPSRPVTDDERETIQMYRDLIAELLPAMRSCTKAECQTALREWWRESRKQFNRRTPNEN